MFLGPYETFREIYIWVVHSQRMGQHIQIPGFISLYDAHMGRVKSTPLVNHHASSIARRVETW